MKIAQFICHLDVGGAETLVKDLSYSLAQHGHEVTVILLDQDRATPQAILAKEQLLNAGISVVSLNRKPGQAPVAATLALARVLTNQGCEVIHSHLPLPDVVATLALICTNRPIRHISTIHNSNLTNDGKAWHWTTPRRVNVFCSKSAAAANPQLSKQTRVIVNGTSLQRKDAESQRMREKIRREFEVAASDILLLNVGRLAEQKNQQCLLHATQILQEKHRIQCLVVGRSDASSPNLAHLVKDLKLDKIAHLGGPRTDVPALLSAADIFVSTSLWEGLPLSVLEALFSGIPCVLSDLPEHREIGVGIPGVNFADPRSPESFALAIEQVLSKNLVARDVLIEQRKTLLAPYTIDMCASSYLELYNDTKGTEAT